MELPGLTGSILYMKNNFNTNEKYNDLGFGTKTEGQKERYLNKDGTFNVEKKGISIFQSQSIFNALINMSMPVFIGIIFLVFVLINSLFALIYVIIGIEQLAGLEGNGFLHNYFEAFFFSVQTFTTVGYGRISPIGFTASLIASFEALTGILSAALATGLLFAKFSRPNAKILFSENAVIAPYKDIKAFMFRIANQRKNQIIQLEAMVSLSRNEMVNGERLRKFYELKLERKHLEFFPLSWTIVHPIDEESPLHHQSKEDFEASNPEFIIQLKGLDDTYSQTIYTRFSYIDNEILWERKFASIFDLPDRGKITINLDKINDVEKVI